MNTFDQFLLFNSILFGGGIIMFFIFHLLSKLKANRFKKPKKRSVSEELDEAKELAIPDTA
jgi:hypothetical protein